MRILCMSKYAIPYSEHAEALCIGKLLRSLMAAGHDVRLITARDLLELPRMPGPGWEEVGCATRYIKAEPHVEPTRLSLHTTRAASVADPYRVPADQDKKWVYAAEEALLDEVEHFAPNAVLTTHPQPDHLAALRARRRRAFLWIASFNDPWDRRTMFENPPWYSLSHLWHRRVLSHIASRVDAFIFPSARLATFERQFSFGPWPETVAIIPHVGAIANKPAPRDQERFRLVHVGDMRPRGRADCLLPEGLQAAIRTEPNLEKALEVVFVGEVPEHFKRRAETLAGSIFTYIPWVAYGTSLEYIRSADVNVLIERKSPVDILMLAKLADYALAEAPILALGPRVGNMPDWAAKGECLHAPADDAHEIADRLLTLYRAWRAAELRSYRHEKLAQICRPENGAREFEALVRSIEQKQKTKPMGHQG